MHNCLILGSGRSGTSMVAGSLARSGYYMGDNLIPARGANPKGFFESPFINLQINEASLKHCDPSVRQGHWWITPLPLKQNIYSDHIIRRRIRSLVSHTPYCYKDPRFCYTLPIWRPYLENVKFVCVFRHPLSTVQSILREVKIAKYLHTILVDAKRALAVWESAYIHVLRRHVKKGDWIFIHYDQMFDRSAVDRLSEFLNAPVDVAFPDRKFKKQIEIKLRIPRKVKCLYNELCKLAKYSGKR